MFLENIEALQTIIRYGKFYKRALNSTLIILHKNTNANLAHSIYVRNITGPEKCTRTKYTATTRWNSANSKNTYHRWRKTCRMADISHSNFSYANAVQFLRKVFYDRSTDPRDAHLMQRKTQSCPSVENKSRKILYVEWKKAYTPTQSITIEKVYLLYNVFL